MSFRNQPTKDITDTTGGYAALTVIDTAKSTEHFMTPLGRSRGKCDHGAVDAPKLGSPAREGQVLLELGPET